MEEQKIDKRSKEYKAQVAAQERMVTAAVTHMAHGIGAPVVYPTQDSTPLERLIASGISVSKAEFHAAVNNVDNVPETHFSEKSDNKGRRAEMWLTAGGNLLICKQETAKRETKYVGVPAASVKFVHFK